MNIKQFASCIDHTLLEKDAPPEKYDTLAREAESLGTNVCVPPKYVERVNHVPGEVAVVIGFPQGNTFTQTKINETRNALKKGATEVDVAADISALKSGNHQEFVDDIREITELDVTTKSIIETGLLTDDEKREAARLSVEAGVDYVKTCTGFAPGEATVKDVRLISDEVGDRAKIKASGGIKEAENAMNLMEAGASRIGSSSGADLVEDYDGGA